MSKQDARMLRMAKAMAALLQVLENRNGMVATYDLLGALAMLVAHIANDPDSPPIDQITADIANGARALIAARQAVQA